MIGLGWQEMFILAVICGLPFIGITIALVVLLLAKKKKPQDDE